MKKLSNLKGLLILVFMSVTLSGERIMDPVKDRHAWALADHFAISIGFLDNGFDFFHPRTHCLNPQFPAYISKSKEFWSSPINRKL